MVNEAIIIELFKGGRPIRYTCADGTAIAKGTMLQISGDRTVSAHSALNQPIAGIASSEKVINDGSTHISAYTNGIFDLKATASGITPLGNICAASANANQIVAADGDDLIQSSEIGQCLEAHGNSEVAAVRINK